MGISNTQAQERITPDKWQPNTNIPQTHWRKAALFSMAAIVPFFAISPQALTQPETPKVFSQQPVVITTQLSFQYQAKVDPLVPIVPPETVTVDKWFAKTSEPRFDVKRNQHLYPAFSVVDPSQLSQAERVSLDKWEQPQSLPRWDAKRQQQTYPSFFFNPLPIGTPTTFVDAAVNQTNTPYFRRPQNQHLYPALSIDAKQLTQPETPKVFANESVILSVPRATQYQSQTEPLVQSAQVSFEDWFVQASEPIRVQGNRKWLTPIELISPNRTERVSLDKWQQPISQPRFDLKRNQFLYPSFVVDANQLTSPETAKVFGQQSLVLVYPRSTQYQALTFVNEGNLHEAVNLDKWFKETNRPRFDIARLQYLYPNFFFSPFPLPSPEVLTIDKWTPLVNLPVWDKKRHQFLFQTFAIDPRHLLDRERITIEKWFRETQQPRFDIPRKQYLNPSFSIDPYALVPHWNLTPRTTNDDWNGVNRSIDASYNSVNRSSDANYNSVTRSSDDSYNPVSRDSDDSWNQTHREA